MAQRQARKMNIAFDLELLPWLEIESGRRGCSMTALVNAAVKEQRDNASDAVKAVYEAALATREQQQ